MTEEEYEAKRTFIQKEYNNKLKALNKECASSNNPYKIGDVITDHYHTIRIERIGLSSHKAHNDMPQCVYRGVELKKDGTPKKRQVDTVMFQCNVKEKK